MGDDGKRGDWEVFTKEQINTDQLAVVGFFVSVLADDLELSLKTNYFSMRNVHTAILDAPHPIRTY